MDELDTLKLDRELRRAAEAWRDWRRGLRLGIGFNEEPFQLFASVVNVETFRSIDELPRYDPLRQPLRRWSYRLLEQCTHLAAVSHVEQAWRQQQHVALEPEYGRYTLSELLRRALDDPARRKSWFSQLFAAARGHGDAVAALWEQRAEFAQQAGVGTPDAIERACADSGLVARHFLEQSRDLSQALCMREVDGLLEQALATKASEGWPGRMQLRTLGSWLDEARLLEGLRLDPGRMPEPFGPASYLRAMARIGAAWVDATAPRRQPFVIAHDPYGLRRRTVGALFGILPLFPAFARRRLGLSTARIRDHRRALGLSLLIASRAAAVRVLLRGPALTGLHAFRQAHRDLCEEVFGTSLPASAAGTFLRLHADDDQRFSGLLLAVVQTQKLIDEHDEDWFRNPRATDQLRSEADLSPLVHVTREELDASVEPCCALLAEAAE